MLVTPRNNAAAMYGEKMAVSISKGIKNGYNHAFDKMLDDIQDRQYRS